MKPYGLRTTAAGYGPRSVGRRKWQARREREGEKRDKIDLAVPHGQTKRVRESERPVNIHICFPVAPREPGQTSVFLLHSKFP